MTLSAADIERFQRDGFLVFEGLLADQEIETLRQRTAEIAEGRHPRYNPADIELEPSAGGRCSLDTVRKLNHCAANDEVFFEHARNPKILDVVECLLGP